MKRLLIAAAAAVLVPNAALAFDGLCIDNREAGCVDRYIPFRGKTLDFCEASCTLTNRVDVRDMDGALYDVECLSDSGSKPIGPRVFWLLQTGGFNTERLIMVDESNVWAVVACPR